MRGNFDHLWRLVKYCIRFVTTGDARVNIQPHVAVMHTLWVREHNRIAEKLAALNSHWTDERLYQEARRIVVAEIQHITYNEWMPAVLG